MYLKAYKSNKSSNIALSKDFVIINGLVHISITLCFISHLSQLLIYSLHLFSLSNVKRILIFLHLSFGKNDQKWPFILTFSQWENFLERRIVSLKML